MKRKILNFTKRINFLGETNLVYCKVFIIFFFMFGCGDKPVIFSDNIGEDSFSCPSNFSGKIEKYNEISRKKTKEFHVINGKRNGISTVWSLGGNKISEEMYRDGLQDGKSIEWWESGRKKVESFYDMGVAKHSFYWGENGVLLSEITRNDNQIVNIKHLENGGIEEYIHDVKKDLIKFSAWNNMKTKIKEYSLQNGKMHGKYIVWNEKGIKVYECIYKNGLGFGKFKQWDNDGQFQGEYSFSDSPEHHKFETK